MKRELPIYCVDLWERVAKEGLSEELELEIVQEYGQRGEKALAAVKDHLVKKYLDFFVVVGASSEYMVEGSFCKCADYIYNISNVGGMCWHALAVKLARAVGVYDEFKVWYQDVNPDF